MLPVITDYRPPPIILKIVKRTVKKKIYQNTSFYFICFDKENILFAIKKMNTADIRLFGQFTTAKKSLISFMSTIKLLFGTPPHVKLEVSL